MNRIEIAENRIKEMEERRGYFAKMYKETGKSLYNLSFTIVCTKNNFNVLETL